MGAWGTALFSDDTAADVRDGYRDHIGDGFTGPQATDKLVQEWSDVLKDPDEAAVFWLSLASTQWNCGRLEPRVKAKALAIIDEEADLRRWREQGDAELLNKRKAVLAKVQAQLLSPQPPEKRIPKRFRDSCDWELGEVVSYRLLSGRLALFRVIGFHTDKGGTSPVCERLNWLGTEAPSQEFLQNVKGKGPQFLLGRTRAKELPAERVERLGIKIPSERTPAGPTVFLWSHLDRQLRDVFGID
jgi:hypothetical protein